MIQDLDPEEQFEQEPVESEENQSPSDEPVLSEPKTVQQEPPARQEDSEPIPDHWRLIQYRAAC
jgi:hypothetical protein